MYTHMYIPSICTYIHISHIKTCIYICIYRKISYLNIYVYTYIDPSCYMYVLWEKSGAVLRYYTNQVFSCKAFMCHMTHPCETWHMYTCVMTHPYVWQNSWIRVTRLIYACDMTHTYMWRDAYIRVTWHIHSCDMTHARSLHGSRIYVIYIYIYTYSHLYVP